MSILSLLPILLKALPFAIIGLLYWLFKWEKAKRKRAEVERDNAQASFEVAQETGEIKEEEAAIVQKIEQADLGGLVDLLHNGLRQPADKG